MANESKHEDYNFVDGVAPEGIVSPSADALIEKAESKYGLVIFGARRARQINAYYETLQESNNSTFDAPLVDAEPTEKPLSVAMREIIEGQVSATHIPDGRFNENGLLVAEEPVMTEISLDDPYTGAIEEEYIPAEQVVEIEEIDFEDVAE